MTVHTDRKEVAMCIACDQHSALNLCGIKTQGTLCKRRAVSHIRLDRRAAILTCDIHQHVVFQRHTVADHHRIGGACGLPDFTWKRGGCELTELTDEILAYQFPGFNGVVGD